jgi:hypothetical protein
MVIHDVIFSCAFEQKILNVNRKKFFSNGRAVSLREKRHG